MGEGFTEFRYKMVVSITAIPYQYYTQTLMNYGYRIVSTPICYDSYNGPISVGVIIKFTLE